MAFGGEMSDDLRSENVDCSRNHRCVANVALDQLISWIVCNRQERFDDAGIGQFVIIEYVVIRFVQDVPDQRSPDKPGTSRHENSQSLSPLRSSRCQT